MTVRVRPASDDDWPAIWPIWRSVVDAGGTYLWPPGTTESDARRFWMLPPPAEVLVVEDDAGAVGGTAVLKPNQPGLGDHVANASFMIDAARHGEGLGRALAEGVLDHARRAGYRAMQFNAVVATNAAAIALWKSLGFEVVGTVPGGYRYPSEGPVDLLIMYRAL